MLINFDYTINTYSSRSEIWQERRKTSKLGRIGMEAFNRLGMWAEGCWKADGKIAARNHRL